MTNFNYSLSFEDYTWENAILWGNFKGHCKKVNEGTFDHRLVHVLIAAFEFLPIIGQIASIFETIIIKNFGKPTEQQIDLFLSNNVSDDDKIKKNLSPVTQNTLDQLVDEKSIHIASTTMASQPSSLKIEFTPKPELTTLTITTKNMQSLSFMSLPKKRKLGVYRIQDVSPLDHTILFNGREWKCPGLVDISNWSVYDKIILSQDDYQDKGWYLVENERLSESNYFCPCGALAPTIGGSANSLVKTKWKGRLERVNRNSIYLSNHPPIQIQRSLSSLSQNWQQGDLINLIQDGEKQYLKNITRNDKKLELVL
jgi:hypothetical protein